MAGEIAKASLTPPFRANPSSPRRNSGPAIAAENPRRGARRAPGLAGVAMVGFRPGVEDTSRSFGLGFKACAVARA